MSSRLQALPNAFGSVFCEKKSGKLVIIYEFPFEKTSLFTENKEYYYYLRTWENNISLVGPAYARGHEWIIALGPGSE